MQRISEVMTADVQTIAPHDSVRRAAQLMDELNVGSIPVCDGSRLVGMITDRDITIRATSTGQPPEDTEVQDIMSSDVQYCFEDQQVDEVMETMRDIQIRRVPVIDRNSHKLVGIISLGDLATKHSAEVDRTLQEISMPSEPDRAQPRA